MFEGALFLVVSFAVVLSVHLFLTRRRLRRQVSRRPGFIDLRTRR